MLQTLAKVGEGEEAGAGMATTSREEEVVGEEAEEAGEAEETTSRVTNRMASRLATPDPHQKSRGGNIPRRTVHTSTKHTYHPYPLTSPTRLSEPFFGR